MQTSHGSYGPPERLNRLQTTWTPGTDLRTHRTATTQKHTPSGAHRGSADPTGRPNRPCGAHSGASTWCSVIGPRGHPRGIWVLSRRLHKPINRRRGGVRRGGEHLKPFLTFASFSLSHSLLVEVKPHPTTSVCVWRI